MPNAYKFNVSTQSGCISKGNAQIGVESINYGPSSFTDFWSGITPPSGGYAWYKDAGISNGAKIRTAANDQTLINIVNEEFAQGFTSATQAMTYINANSSWLVMNIDYPNIPTSGLTLITDSGLVCSYPKSGSELLSLDSYSKKDAKQYLANGPVYTSGNGGGILFDGIDDVSYFDDNDGVYFGIPLSAAFTAIHIFQSTDINWYNSGGGLNNLYNDGAGFSLYPITGTKQLTFYVGDIFNHNALNIGTHIATDIQVPMFYAVSSNGSNLHKGYFGGTSSVFTSTSNLTRSNVNHEIFLARHGYTANYQKMTSYIVMYYNRQLSDTEVNQIYLAYATRFGFLGQTMAQAHYDRVVADGGVLPIGVAGLASVLNSIAAAYNVSTTAAFNAAVPVFLDPHYTGYKLGTGSGTTLGQAARTVYAINPSADVTQSTAASQPLLLAHSGVNYWFGSAVAGNYISSPNSAASNIRGNIEIIAYDIKMFSNAAENNIYGRYDGGQRQLLLGISATRNAYLTLSFDGLNNSSNTSTTTVPAYGTEFSLKATRDASSGDIKFYISLDSGANWAQLGTTVSGTTGNTFNSTSAIQVGSYINGNLANFAGKIRRITVANSIGGTPVVDFNPASYTASTSQTQWTSTTGEVWTINTGTATTGYKGVLVDRTIMQGDGVDDSLQTASATWAFPCTNYIAVNRFSDNVDALIDVSGANDEFYFNGSTYRYYRAGGTDIVFSPTITFAKGSLLAVTLVSNGAGSLLQKNNGTASTGNQTNTASVVNPLVILNGSDGSTNSIMNTFIRSSSADNSTVRTAMYNIIRQLNNLAIGSLGQTMAQAHYDRVVADGGVLPIGVAGLASVLNSIAAAYNVSTTAEFNAAVPVFLDPHYTGYKLGTGSGTTLGQAARTVYAINPSADVTQATAASQPLLLAHSGVNYWFGSGVSGNYCSTPNAAANQITGDIEVIAYANFVLGATMEVISKWRTGTSGFILLVQTGGFIEFYIKLAAGIVDVVSTVAITAGVKYIKATRNSITGDIKFYTSIDGITYAQLGTTVSSTSGAISSSTSDVIIGGYGALNFNGKIYRVTISNSIGGTPVVDFNPASYSASTSQTQWTSTTGEVWTINTGPQLTGYYGVLVNKTIMQLDGIDDVISQASLNRNNNCSQYLVYKTNIASGSGYPIIDATNANYQNALTPEGLNFKLYFNGSISGIPKSYTYNNLSTFTGKTNAGIANSLQINNDTATTNTYATTPSGTGLNIGKAGFTSWAYQKGIVQTYICSSSTDSDAISTLIYNLLKSINNSYA